MNRPFHRELDRLFEARAAREITRRAFLRRVALLTGSVGLARALAGPSPAAAQPAAAPRSGGQLLGAQETDPVDLDPHRSNAFAAVQVFEHVYSSLVQYDEKLNVVPALAESWQQPEPTTLVFRLRPGVRFHNGRELDAHDVRVWHERLMDPKTAAPFKAFFQVIRKVEPVDARTVRLTLEYPFAPLLANFASLRGSAIVPRELIEKGVNLSQQAVGTGPFRLTEFVSQSHARYEKNPQYWEKGLPYLDGLILKIMVEEDTRVAALRAGALQYAPLTAVAAQRLQGDPRLLVLRSPKAWLTLMLFNNTRPPFTDARVRRAIAMAIDRKEVIDKAVAGAGVLSGPMPTGHGDWYVPPAELGYRVDVDGARRLLAEAGFPNGFQTTLQASPQYPEWVAGAVVVQQHLKRIGVDATIQQLEWGQVLKNINRANRAYDLCMVAYTFFPDPDNYHYNFYHSTAQNNFSGFSNADYDRKVEEARRLPDRAKRRELYLELQRFLLEQAPSVYLYVGESVEGLAANVRGYVPSYTGRRIFLKQTWLA